MSEDAALQARIAALSNRIDQQKQSVPPASSDSQYRAPPSRWSPYQTFAPAGRGATRGGRARGGRGTGFRNRTLVNNSNLSAQAQQSAHEPKLASSVTAASAGVSTHDRGRMQWTSATVFEKKAQDKKEAVEETVKAKKQAVDEAQKNRLLQHVYGTTTKKPSTSSPDLTPREIIINDLRFRVATNGSKLIRIFDGPNALPRSTPREAKVAGIPFVRTKNGNLVRQGLLNNKRVATARPSKKLCPDFTPTGSCLRGNRCRYKHDIDKVAICKEYLRSGHCANGEDCNLSHDPTSHRVPICTHFLRSNCTKPDCRYSHVHIDASAPVCSDFARLGYCEKGAACADRHVSECPDYTNTGVCRNRKCRLPHIDRAGTLRRAAAARLERGDGSDHDDMDVSSGGEDDEEIGSDDADSDEVEEEDLLRSTSGGHELSQQQDFVPFS